MPRRIPPTSNTGVPRMADNFIDHFVAVVLNHIDREYPNKLDHVMNGPEQVKGPRELHPIFYGSFDWHSCVHGHWLLLRALRNYPSLAQAGALRELLDARFTPENVAVEVEYLGQKRRETFERTYGWAWLLKVAAEIRLGKERVSASRDPIDAETAGAFGRWDAVLEPLTTAFVERYLKFLPKATYPIRVGTHQNSAFGLALALDFARVGELADLREMIERTARGWYGRDADYPGNWEPSGTDFLSPGLMEAECMRRVLRREEFVGWFDGFFPKLAAGEREPAALFEPAFVSDRTDGQITHLDGLNLSRAWCWRSIRSALPEGDARRPLLDEAYRTHLEAALPHVTGDYMGEHWLATFAMLALTE